MGNHWIERVNKMVKLKNLTGLKDLKQEDIKDILDIAIRLEDVCAGRQRSRILENKVMSTFFYEPSTRTRLSFETAMLRLGGLVVSMANAQMDSSVWKGETLSDTIRTIENYADVIVLRHPEAGAADEAVRVSRVPILNAGDGSNEHPTQGLLDLLTIQKERGSLDGLNVALVGDLKHTRSTNSLTLGLSNFDVNFTFVSPRGFETSDWILDVVKKKGRFYRQTEDLESVIDDMDVIYMCRIQKERLKSAREYEAIRGIYVLHRSLLDKAPRTITVLHHLPRIGELAEDVDSYPGAAYFRQPFNGVLVRAALLAIVFDRVPEPRH
jgi:aspartate carbamoyltransferase catalytic subunit